jgi:hypothetical protein
MMTRVCKRTSSGTRWSTGNDRIIQTLYPDYPEMRRRLRNRSYYAIRNRARYLGVAVSRYIWTNHDKDKLRKLYLCGATRAEVAAAFPYLTQSQICSKAGHIGLLRARRPPHVLGIPPLDDVRRRAAVRGWTLRRLDKAAKTGRYFQQTTRRIDWNHIARAVGVLEGAIDISWLRDNE